MSGPIVIVGDTLLDRDVDGAVARLCPDAPAPVLDEQSASDRPGGAGLAALFAAASDREVVLVTAFANDPGGARLSELLAAAGVQVFPMTLAGATPEKVRLRAGGQVLLRLDRGDGASVAGRPSEPARAVIAGASVVLVSDYGRGVARVPALRTAVAQTRAPVVWDPHPRGPAPVAGARLVTPNEAEAQQLAGVTPRGGNRAAILTRVAQQLRERWRAGAVAVTMGADGALLSHAGPTPLVVPAPSGMGGNSCGAGDRFSVSAALGLADGQLVTEAVTAAVAAASSYVADGGVDTVLRGRAWESISELAGTGAAGALASRVRGGGGRVVATGGCFDLLHAGHIATLEAARRLGDCLVVCVNSDHSVAALKGPGRPVVGQADRVRMLAALRCVDAVVVFDEPTPTAVLSWLRPDVWVKGGDYAGSAEDLPEAELVRRWGGQAVVVPYLAGRSTTTLIANAARNGHSGKGPR